MRFLPASLLLLFAASLTAPLQAQAQNEAQLSYTIEPASSAVNAKVRFMALSKKTVTFPAISGAVEITPENLTEITLEVEIDASMAEAKEAYILDTIKGEKFFDVANHPKLRFVGNVLTMDGPKKGVVAGELTARGITLPQTLELNFSEPLADANGVDSLTVKGRIKIDRRDYDMNSYPLIVGNTVDIRITANLVPAKEE